MKYNLEQKMEDMSVVSMDMMKGDKVHYPKLELEGSEMVKAVKKLGKDFKAEIVCHVYKITESDDEYCNSVCLEIKDIEFKSPVKGDKPEREETRYEQVERSLDEAEAKVKSGGKTQEEADDDEEDDNY